MILTPVYLVKYLNVQDVIKLFHISAIDIFSLPKELIKENRQLADALDLVQGQKHQKAFDYSSNTVEGKINNVVF